MNKQTLKNITADLRWRMLQKIRSGSASLRESTVREIFIKAVILKSLSVRKLLPAEFLSRSCQKKASQILKGIFGSPVPAELVKQLPLEEFCASIPESEWLSSSTFPGTLFQFFVSPRKKEISGKQVNPEDIPTATQLFTPDWIAKFMLHNSLGELWRESRPSSRSLNKLEFLIKHGKSPKGGPLPFSPEKLTILDPACGTGHLLLEAYDILFMMYEEAGIKSETASCKILQKKSFWL